MGSMDKKLNEVIGLLISLNDNTTVQTMEAEKTNELLKELIELLKKDLS